MFLRVMVSLLVVFAGVGGVCAWAWFKAGRGRYVW